MRTLTQCQKQIRTKNLIDKYYRDTVINEEHFNFDIEEVKP